MLRAWGTVIQIAFTYVGTIVGAGFATGQEILQFFSRYGAYATGTILLAGLMFVAVGTRIMVLAHRLGAESYEVLNKYLFGERLGRWFSHFSLVMLFGVTCVMLAGGGSLFHEHFRLTFQAGLLIMLVLAYIIISRGLQAIVAVNSFVVPMMALFCGLVVIAAMRSPGAGNWLQFTGDHNPLRVWTAPFLYCAYNLATAQAVLVPLGSSVKDRRLLYWGGAVGGVLITAMMMAGHFALTSQMPGIMQFEIPMGKLVAALGPTVQLLFICVIFGEIFTTFIADVYGLSLQIRHRTGWPAKPVIAAILIGSYMISQIGFSALLSTLYPLFGMLSMLWFVRVAAMNAQSGSQP
jgi:uncharacterized membrane protein YkvI